MAGEFSKNQRDNERNKFIDDPDLKAAVKTVSKIFGSVSGSFTPGGLSTAGKHTEVVINSSTWTKLPSTALSARNAIAIQNTSTTEKIKVNYIVTTEAAIDTDIPGFTGQIIFPEQERFYDITDAIKIFAKSETSTFTINVEELS